MSSSWKLYQRAVSPLKAIGRHELIAIIVITLVLGGVWGFVELADEVMEGDVQRMDEKILLAMRNPDDHTDPIGPGWLEEMGRDFTALGGVGFLILLVVGVTGMLLLERKFRAAMLIVLAVVSGNLLSNLLKHQFDRPRPDLVPHGSITYTASFPSGHSLMAALTFLTIGVMLVRFHKSLGAKAYFLLLAVLLAILVGVSRVYLGVHWPTDVLAGWTLGAVWALIWWLIALLLQRRGQIDDEGDEPDAEIGMTEQDEREIAAEGTTARPKPGPIPWVEQ